MIKAMKSTMRDLFNIQPNHFQQRIIPHILMMMKGTIPAQPMLLVQSTGGGSQQYHRHAVVRRLVLPLCWKTHLLLVLINAANLTNSSHQI
jgi:hypothetical protein